MVKISTKGRYGLRALLDLALHESGKPVLLSQIAERQAISKRYLERLFTQLRDSGIIRSVRGAAGGYVLAKDPAKISILEVLESLEGPISPVDCTLDTGCCNMIETCVTHTLWNHLADIIRHSLSEVSLQELIVKQSEIVKKQIPMFYI